MRAGKDDPQRIEAAHRLLAQAPGEAIDRLTVLAARLLRTAHAQVSIFTERQVVLTPAAAGRPPADALCAATFAGAEPEPAHQIAAYLGVPIETDDARIGVLCVYDEEPFEWTRHHADVLRDSPPPLPPSSSAAPSPPSSRPARSSSTSASPPRTSAASTGTSRATRCTGTSA